MKLLLPAILIGLALGTLCRLHQLQRDLDQLQRQQRPVPAFRLDRSKTEQAPEQSVPWTMPAPEIIWL
jgi:hypothetical protein